MNAPSPDNKPSPSLAALQQIDRLCLEFEQQWKAGREPSIETALQQVGGQQAGLLFSELLRLDLDYRGRRGERPQAADYRTRFPDFASLVEAAFDQAGTTRARIEETVGLAGAGGRAPCSSPATMGDFGDYELLEEIARGGMGVVYKARDRRLQRTVALKMILSGQFASQEAVQRFHSEAQAAAQLDHPGIVSVFEVGQLHDQHYFSMAYVDGQSLEDRLRRQPMDPRAAAQLLERVARAIHYAHSQGVVHRDLKPANVLLDQDGQPRITDFGLAKLADSNQHLTTTGQILGTPGYMPPEQVAAQHDSTGPAADIYALGAILYRILTGRPPFQTTNVLETLFEVLEKEPIPPRALDHHAPRDLETICLKCLAKDPGQRYASALELAAELQRYLDGEPIAAQPPSLLTRFFVWARQRPALVVTIAALVGFYTYHLLMVYVWHDESSSDPTFHRLSTGVALVWLVAAWQLQSRLLRPDGHQKRVVFAWAAMEIALLTALLAFPGIDGPQSSLALVYLLLLAGAALRGGPSLILFVYQLSLGGYLCLVLFNYLHPDMELEFQRIIPFVVSLSVIGLIQYMVVLQLGRR